MKLIGAFMSMMIFSTPNTQANDTKLNLKIPLLRIKYEKELLKSYGKAWNSSDVDGIVNHFAEGEILYTDVLRQKGIKNKLELKAYLTKVFTRFPKQNWTSNVSAYPSITVLGEWAIYYHYKLYDNINAQTPSFSGSGMEKIKFDPKGSGKIISDEIHMIFDQMDSRAIFDIYP
ncbi:MAG: hypothetical protein IPM57_11770 [Oligoflexia bacterium]|nr:hypothetical protein [Oligoflexia bacterium]